jgi:hypothetical protein
MYSVNIILIVASFKPDSDGCFANAAAGVEVATAEAEASWRFACGL